MSEHRAIHEINQNLYFLAKVIFPSVLYLPSSWPHLIDKVENNRRSGRRECRLVKWKFPPTGTFKCNTDARSNGTNISS